MLFLEIVKDLEVDIGGATDVDIGGVNHPSVRM